MTIKRILNIALIYICWLPIAILKDIASIFYVPFDTNRFCQTYVNLHITTHNIENSLNKISESDDEDKPTNDWYKTTDIGFTSNKCDLTEDSSEDEQIYSQDD